MELSKIDNFTIITNNKTKGGVNKKSLGRCGFCSSSHSVVCSYLCISCIKYNKIKYQYCGVCGKYKSLSSFVLCFNCNKETKENITEHFNLPL